MKDEHAWLVLERSLKEKTAKTLEVNEKLSSYSIFSGNGGVGENKTHTRTHILVVTVSLFNVV